MKVLCSALILPALLGSADVMPSCGKRERPARIPPTPSAPAEPTKSASSVGELTEFQLTAAQAQARGLPAVGFRLRHPGELGGGAASEPEVYATFSGPPGGTLYAQIRAYRGANSEGIRKAVSEGFASFGNLRDFSSAQEVMVAGQPRPTLQFVAGESQARAQGCAVLVSSPGKGNPNPTLMLVLLLGNAQDGGDCPAVLRHPMLAPLLQTFAWQP